MLQSTVASNNCLIAENGTVQFSDYRFSYFDYHFLTTEYWTVPFSTIRQLLDATVDCNILTDVLTNISNKKSRLHCISLQEITRNTSSTPLKYQNDWFCIMSMRSCNLKFVVISHIYTLFQCCLFNLSAFYSAIIEFWWKNWNPLKLMPAPFKHAALMAGTRITVAWDFFLACGQLWPIPYVLRCVIPRLCGNHFCFLF